MQCIDGCCYVSGDCGYSYNLCTGASDEALRDALECRDHRPYKVENEQHPNGVRCTHFMKDDSAEAWGRYNFQQAFGAVQSHGLLFFSDVLHWINRVSPK